VLQIGALTLFLLPLDHLPGFVTVIAWVLMIAAVVVTVISGADYVRTAKAKGLSSFRIVTIHTLRNSLIPVVTYLGADLGALMGGAIVTESIFNIHGVGGTLYHAIIKGEPSTVVSFVTILVIVYIVGNLIVDLLYPVLDPRTRYA